MIIKDFVVYSYYESIFSHLKLKEINWRFLYFEEYLPQDTNYKFESSLDAANFSFISLIKKKIIKRDLSKF